MDRKRISAAALYAMRYIAVSPLAKLYTFTVRDDVLRELERHIYRYTELNTDKRFKKSGHPGIDEIDHCRMEKTMEKIVALAKSRGFVYPGSEIYGGLANTWDYGNLGVELKNNVKRAWWQKFIQENPYNVGVDCAILMNPQTWVASGHLGGFSDPLMDCKECHERFRADKLIEDFCRAWHCHRGAV